jgi:hypothetical protein
VRYSKNKARGNGGRKIVEWITEKGWYILNGTMEGDWEGEFTYVGVKGCTVIDYVMIRVDIRERIYKFRVGEKVDSNYLLLEMESTGEEEEERDPDSSEQEKKGKEEIETILWDNEAKEVYAERTEELCNTEELEENETDTLEEKWKKIKTIVHGAMVKRRIRKRRKSWDIKTGGTEAAPEKRKR